MIQISSMFDSKKIPLCWIPNHIRIKEKEEADSAAKPALNMAPNIVKILYNFLKPQNIIYSIQNCNNVGITTYTINYSC